jgi:hypothetical protein
VRGLAALLVLPALAACGIVWEENGTRHAVGFGWISWPSGDTAARPAAVSGVDLLGAGLIATRGGLGLHLGYLRERVVDLPADSFVTLDCLDCDLATASPRGGQQPPGETP